MTNINRAAAGGVAFFLVILAGFVGIKVDQTTVAILAGLLIGIIVAFVTTMLIVTIARRPDEPVQQQPPTQQLPATHHHHYDQRRVVVVVNVPADANGFQRRMTVASELRVVPSEAQRMIDAGEVQCLPAGR